MANSGLHTERRRILSESFAAADPDVLVTELYPFGRRSLAAEYDELLARAVTRVRKPIVLSSVRDILVPPSKRKQIAATEQRLISWYDGVLVHSDPGTIALAASWPTTPAIEALLHYTGFVAHPFATTSPVGPGMDDILVSASRRPGGDKLFAAALDAALSRQNRTWRLLVGGSDAEHLLPWLRARISSPQVIVEPARRDFRDLLMRAAAYVGQCGYNTALDLMLSGTPAVLVPFEAGGDVEQVTRAGLLVDRGSFIVLREADLGGERLNRALDAICNAPRRNERISSDGATRSVEIVTQWVEGRKFAGT